MTRNIWTRALWGGIAGTIAGDLILLLGRIAGGVKIDLFGDLARLLTTAGVAKSPSGMILGFVVHLLFGTLWALFFTAMVRVFHSRHNTALGIVNGLILWLLWGLILPPARVAPAPWAMGTATTIFTLVQTLAYGLVVGYITSEDVVRA